MQSWAFFHNMLYLYINKKAIAKTMAFLLYGNTASVTASGNIFKKLAYACAVGPPKFKGISICSRSCILPFNCS